MKSVGTVSNVGYYVMPNGIEVFRLYFDNRQSFVEVAQVKDSSEHLHVRVYNLFKMDAANTSLKNVMFGDDDEPGLLGWPEFAIDGLPYLRSWNVEGNYEPVDPVELSEEFFFPDRTHTTNTHNLMQYERQVQGIWTEYMIADWAEIDDGEDTQEVFQTWVGAQINPENLIVAK